MTQGTQLLGWINLHVASFLAETFTHGTYCVLFFLCLIKLIRSGPAGPGNNLRSLILISAILMFCIATAHFVLLLQQSLSAVVSVQGSVTLRSVLIPWYGYTKASLEVTNCLLGDVVMLSIGVRLGKRSGRDCPLAGTRYKLYGLPALLLTASLITGIGMVLSSDGGDVLSGSANPHLRSFTAAWISFILATNLVSTSLFIYEIVFRRKEFKKGTLTVFDKPLNVLLFTLTCCGLLYCCTFTLLLILFMIDVNACWIMNHMIPQLAGIYPISTIVVVAVRKYGASTTRPRLPTHSRQRSDTSLQSTREIGFAVPMSMSSLPNISRSTVARSPTTPPTSPACPPRSASRLSMKLFSLRRASRKSLSTGAVPTAVYIEVKQTVTVDDAVGSKTVVSSFARMNTQPLFQPKTTAPRVQ